MTVNDTTTRRPLLILAAATLLVAVGAMGCAGPSLRHVGYTSNSKVWYQWKHPDGRNSITVCDIQPDGSETNCKESDI